jgi:hypothetical protein
VETVASSVVGDAPGVVSAVVSRAGGAGEDAGTDDVATPAGGADWAHAGTTVTKEAKAKPAKATGRIGMGTDY